MPPTCCGPAPISAGAELERTAPKGFIDQVLWPEFSELDHALQVYLHEATLRGIRQEIYSDTSEAQEVSEALAAELTAEIRRRRRSMKRGRCSRAKARRSDDGRRCGDHGARHVIRVFQLTSRCYDDANAGSSTSVGGAAWPTHHRSPE